MESDKKDKIIAGLSMKVIGLSVIVFVLIIAFLIVVFHKPEEIKEQQPFICGTVSSGDYAEQYKNDPVSLDDAAGEKLFIQNCMVCHSLGTDRVTGAGLKGLFTRIPSEKWLFNYIAHADKVYHSGDAYAVKLHKDFPDAQMPDFGYLDEEKITQIIDYLKHGQRAIAIP